MWVHCNIVDDYVKTNYTISITQPCFGNTTTIIIIVKPNFNKDVY